MHRGMDWYRRDPIAFLGGVQGMTARQIAVYSITLDLIYQHGGEINNDPAWIAGWIKDCGPAAVRKTIKELSEMQGKLIINDGKISQKHAKNEAKTQQELIENRRESGKKGGKKSWVLGSISNENSNLGQASASDEKQTDKIRVDNKEKDKSFSTKNITKKDFEIFWELYPKKVNKKKASEVYSSKIKASKDPNQLYGQIAEGLRHYIDCKPDYQDWMHPTTFLNGERWNDRYPEPQRQGGPNGYNGNHRTPKHDIGAAMDAAVALVTGQQPDAIQPSHNGPTIDLEPTAEASGGSNETSFH